MNTQKKTWLDKFDDNGISHIEKLSGTTTTYTRHGYVPMDGDTVSETMKDAHLCVYMYSLPEIKMWDKSLSATVMFKGLKQKD